MADPAIDPSDPLAGWQPGSGAPVAASTVSPDDPLQAAPRKSVLDTSYHTLPSDTRQGQPADDAPARVRAATREGWESGDIITPSYQEKMNAAPGPFGWINRNIVNPAINFPGKALGAVGGAATSTVGELLSDPTLNANTAPALASVGLEPLSALGRDINFYGPLAAATIPAVKEPMFRETAISGPVEQAEREAAIGVRQAAPTPTLPQVFQQQRAATPPDPVTTATIDLLRRSTQPTAMPTPPSPFTPSLLGEQPPPAAPAGTGLLAVPRAGPTPAAAEALTRAQMESQAKGYYSPADQQAAQGAMIHPDAADALRKPVADAVPTDPEKAGYVGDTPLTRMGKVAQDNQGQPMSFDTAVSLDRQLGAQKRAALATPGGGDLAAKIGDAQDALQEKLYNLKDGDTTGDPSVLSNLPNAKQAWLQARKQGQLEDIDYGASLLPEAKQDAYRRAQLTSMLKNDRKMMGWSDDERAAVEDQLKSGNIGPLKSFGLSLFKPAGRVTGAALGGSLFGPGGAYVGSEVGGELAAQAAANVRARIQQLSLAPISQRLTANMPPPPAGWTPRVGYPGD